MPHVPRTITIVVPLVHEYCVLCRSLRHATALALPTMICCGPGEGGVQRLAANPGIDATSPPSSSGPPLVILAGLAGALTQRCAAGSAHWIGRVVDESGHTHVPTFVPPEYDATHHLLPTLTTTRRTCTEPSAKAFIAERTGADLVDLESLHFARLAVQRGWTWGIVRGISDGPHDALPPGVDAWVDQDGRTRFHSVVRAVLHQPWLIKTLPYLYRTSSDALRSIAERLAALRPGAIVDPSESQKTFTPLDGAA